MDQTTLVKTVERHDKDLYHGNGKPGITIRMAQAEDRMTVIESTVNNFVEDRRRRDDKQDRKQNVILAAVLGMLVALVTHYVFHVG